MLVRMSIVDRFGYLKGDSKEVFVVGELTSGCKGINKKLRGGSLFKHTVLVMHIIFLVTHDGNFGFE
jgi:hypothetical protein